MSNLRVKLILDLVNRMKGPAGEARDNLKRVGTEADRLKSKGGADKLRRDLMFLATDSRKAASGIQAVGTAADRLGRTGGSARLREDLKATERQARRTAAAVAASGGGGGGAVAGGAGAALAMAGRGALLPMVAGLGGAALLAGGSQRDASTERRMTRTGITGDADVAATRSGMIELRNLANDVAIDFDKLQGGLDAITASGRQFGEAMQMMPAVARTAQASGAAVDEIANSSTSLMDHLGITAKGLQSAQDILAYGGQLGKFELKDMARYLPSMLPAFKAIGYEGEAGLKKLVAMLQVIRSGTGTAEEAAASANNIFAKMESEATAKNFKDMGIDLPKAMAKARKEGKDLMDVFVQLSEQALKGDLSKLPQLFTDMEFARGMRAILSQREEMARILRQLGNSAGTVDNNLKRILNDSSSQFDRLKEAADRAVTAAGSMLNMMAAPASGSLAAGINSVAQALERAVSAKQALDASNAKDTEIATKLAEGKTLTPEERRRELESRMNGGSIQKQASQISARMDGSKTMDRIARGEVGDAGEEHNRLMARQLDRRIAELEAAGSNTPRNRKLLNEARARRSALGVTDTTPLSPMRRPADAEDREASRTRAIEVEAAMTALANEVRNLRTMAGENRPAGDKLGFRADAIEAERQLRMELRAVVPLTRPAGSGFGLRGAKAPSGERPHTGSGLASFNLSGGQAIKDAFTIDLGEAGMTSIERYTAGLKSGQPQAESAASGVGDGVKGRLSGIDASAEGKAVADSFAAGIKAGTPAVLAAASELAAAANRGIARAGGLSNARALHDGVSE